MHDPRTQAFSYNVVLKARQSDGLGMRSKVLGWNLPKDVAYEVRYEIWQDDPAPDKALFYTIEVIPNVVCFNPVDSVSGSSDQRVPLVLLNQGQG